LCIHSVDGDGYGWKKREGKVGGSSNNDMMVKKSIVKNDEIPSLPQATCERRIDDDQI